MSKKRLITWTDIGHFRGLGHSLEAIEELLGMKLFSGTEKSEDMIDFSLDHPGITTGKEIPKCQGT